MFRSIRLGSILCLFLLGACQGQEWTPHQISESSQPDRAIYGEDDRRELFEVTVPKLRGFADSTVSFMKTSYLTPMGDHFAVSGNNYGQFAKLCPGEPFAEQDMVAYCSGVLVAPDLVVTAGHCMPNVNLCRSSNIVFGFAVQKRGELPKTLAASDVYHCAEVIHTESDPHGIDFAVVRLDRPVVGHQPAKLRQSGTIRIFDNITLVGHPYGLPLKIVPKGYVTGVRDQSFYASVDSFEGNSGSPVFDSQTGALEGVLVRGGQDFQKQGSCYVAYQCNSLVCRGEVVTKISTIMPFLTGLQTSLPQTPTSL